MMPKKRRRGGGQRICCNSRDRLEATFSSNIGNYSRYRRSRHAPICYHGLLHAIPVDDGLAYRDWRALYDSLRAFS